jgi:putative membrane protein
MLMPSRFPRYVFGSGGEPDPRFSLANERTFLAWIRTSLALVAAGVALEALELPISATLRFAAAILFVALGLLAALFSWIGWSRTERAMRAERALPGFAPAFVIVLGVFAAIVLIGVGLVV